MTPDFNIWAEGNLITGLIKQRLISLRITDEAGITSDSVEICLDDRDSLIEMPSSGSKLQMHLGYAETGLVPMGLYIVDEVSLEGHPQVMKIKGHAADLKASFKSQKTDEWHQKTIGDLGSTIAAKHGYEPRIASQFADILLPHILIKRQKAICIYCPALRSSMERSANLQVGFCFLCRKVKPNPSLDKSLAAALLI